MRIPVMGRDQPLVVRGDDDEARVDQQRLLYPRSLCRVRHGDANLPLRAPPRLAVATVLKPSAYTR
ncbi:MAG: hypothetical protein QOF33_4894 [Thermomicrobiales bacterium]|jgi:hypothetical protein|nr:hypothetical protein [Thermomicrobiales bacterium]